ncbi:hypothetical protein EMM73_12900 [Rheinheimera sediminis]|uniref:DUF6436 domain-containing protein n=1 Tax=Rheinheimera sp. YQF-1 TaxID=2499626 RepID=UPI000FD8E9C0|nr:DUF6436 domain-containing protein [Rheinheimera sp. YQF-1]RVT45599.1 hypothetical protein EMM73_12900 [Rheinheimera sp. YQF-1]
MKQQRTTSRVKAAVVLLILWITSSAAAFYWFFLNHYGVFDEQGLWQQQPLLPAQVQHKLRQQLLPDNTWQAVLITDPDCSCSSFAKGHLQRMQQRQSDLAIKELELEEAKALGLDVIAAPLLLLFQHQQLLYAGPLATDLLCSDNASLLDGIIRGTTQLPGFWLNGENTACRCLVP